MNGLRSVFNNESLFEIRLGWSNTQGGKNPPGLGAGGTPTLAGLPTDARVAGGLLSENISGYTSSTGTPVFGRQSTNPQWQYPTVWNPKVNYSRLFGRQSVKTGYEYQHINVEVMDVNPLYGLDSYTGQFTRPAGAAANNVYNLADFMLGLRSQYAISTLFVAQMRQDRHFAYLQDDIRATDRLTFNAGLRYEYGTPMWARGVQPVQPRQHHRAKRHPHIKRVRDDHVDPRSAPAAAWRQGAVVAR
ncbi:MAG: TonB-dependent receptor [Acidobacteriota bacterium]